MVKISFLGSCREVGRSAILIESKNGTNCILDYGIRFSEEDRLPYDIDSKDIKAIALTHCHIDHSGALPFIYKNSNPPLLTNPVTLDIVETLIRDMIKISNYPYPFGFRELEKMMKNSYFIKNGRRQKIEDDFYITFFNAGHIPGSVSILVEVDNKKILYTGDINTLNTNLVNATNSSVFPPIDICIIESTYALREHPPREQLEREFIEHVINIIENGGRVLVPAFGVARSQEMLMIFGKYNYTGNLYIDGMAKLISMIYLEYPESIKDLDFFKNSLKKAKFISRRKARQKIEQSEGVIIAPSGMLRGGAALNYIESILNDSNSAIYLVGYQVEGSPGRGLLDEGIFEFKDKRKINHRSFDMNIEAKCEYNYFDFSSHADGVQIKEYIQNLTFQNSSKNVFCVHGDNKSTTYLASELTKISYNSVAPETGEIYKF